ncbi:MULTISPECIES: TolC family protein [Comamonas]|uniref:TolC family protein n=1 Tax=Comamonas squillarum TaxID=2977320 RepID=A0ABY6A5J4_9BURK|nr:MULTISPECIES: TolC family protein [Comamonas]UXC19651.1 TolC family protein [Comamonas sp. PR12]
MRLFAPAPLSSAPLGQAASLPARYLAAQPRLACAGRAEPQGASVWGIVCALTMAWASSDLQAQGFSDGTVPAQEASQSDAMPVLEMPLRVQMAEPAPESRDSAPALASSTAPSASVELAAPTPAAPVVPASTAPAAALQLAPKLMPGTLAGNASQQQLLTALYTMLSDHPDVRKARAAVESAGYDTHTAEGARWPSFKLGTSAGNAALPQGGRRSSYTAVNAEVRMNLLDGGAISAGIDAAQAMEAAQGSALYTTRQNVLLDALSALLELHRFQTKARIAAESAEIIGQLARVEERRAELGAVGRNDLRQAASRRASALAQQNALEAQRIDAQARFTRFFNYIPSLSWLPEPQVPSFWVPTNEQAALLAAEDQSAELREIGHLIERAQAEVERSKAQRWPTVAAVVSHTRDPKSVLYTEGTRYGVELNWNFGNGFELRDRILKAISELQAQQAQQEAVRRQVHEAASSAWGRWQAGRAREAQLRDAVREASAAFEGYRRLLEVGRGNLSQVLDAQLDVQRLMLDAADAMYDQRINELRLTRTTGQLLPRDLPEHWLDQLFAQRSANAPAPATAQRPFASPGPAPLAGSRAAPARPGTPYTSPPVLTAQHLPLRLDHRWDTQLLSQPQGSGAARALRW